MEIRVNQTIPIERKWVTEAYLKLRKGGKATGVDEEPAIYIRYGADLLQEVTIQMQLEK